jgi:penicillin-insensitive murein endopeptidase
MLLASSNGGCLGTPTPLAPGLHGSVGVPHHGVQTESVELPVRGPGFRRFRPMGTNYSGNPRLVAGLQAAAAAVDQALPGGAPLTIGDLSARHGGRIPGHNSHRTGRDVDLLWYVTTPAGAPVPSPGFIRVASDGLAEIYETQQYLRLDVPREWLLVKSLLLSNDIAVQFMFVSHDVEALLIEYARSKGEPLDLVWHAETVMLEPSDSAPHDDHLHLRIACSPEESVNGCEGGGPYWEWLPEQPSLGPLDPSTLAAIAADDPLETPPDTSVAAVAPGGT